MSVHVISVQITFSKVESFTVCQIKVGVYVSTGLLCSHHSPWTIIYWFGRSYYLPKGIICVGSLSRLARQPHVSPRTRALPDTRVAELIKAGVFYKGAHAL